LPQCLRRYFAFAYGQGHARVTVGDGRRVGAVWHADAHEVGEELPAAHYIAAGRMTGAVPPRELRYAATSAA
jgi:hypothetical protein